MDCIYSETLFYYSGCCFLSIIFDVFFLDHCLTPMKVGPCRGSFPRWHFNAASGVCEKFMFGGCKPNDNNYVSQQECSEACNGTKGTISPSCIIFNSLLMY